MRKIARLLTAIPVAASLGCALAATAAVAAPAGPGLGSHAVASASVLTRAPRAASPAPRPVGWRIVAAFPKQSSIDYLAASGQASAWAVESCRKPCVSGSGVILRHWNGKAWSNVRVPYALNQSYAAGPLGSDGHGGAWLAAIPARTTREYLYHVSAAGHWTRVAIPVLKGGNGTVIAGFAAIPGTSAVYAYGSATEAHGGSEGVILTDRA